MIRSLMNQLICSWWKQGWIREEKTFISRFTKPKMCPNPKWCHCFHLLPTWIHLFEVLIHCMGSFPYCKANSPLSKGSYHLERVHLKLWIAACICKYSLSLKLVSNSEIVPLPYLTILRKSLAFLIPTFHISPMTAVMIPCSLIAAQMSFGVLSNLRVFRITILTVSCFGVSLGKISKHPYPICDQPWWCHIWNQMTSSTIDVLALCIHKHINLDVTQLN